MAEYQVKSLPGWHCEPEDPEIYETDDAREAAMQAGCRMDLVMPGNSNRYNAYAVDSHGCEVERIDSFCCDECADLTEWNDGPTGTMDGEVLECPEVVEKHLVMWICDECAAEL